MTDFMGKPVKVKCFTFTNPSPALKSRFLLVFIRQKPKQKAPNGSEVKLDLEEILSSACRRKIIKYLAEYGATNIMRLILGIRGKYPQTNAELRVLQEEGIIIDRHDGRFREIRLNRENSKRGVLLEALKLLHGN